MFSHSHKCTDSPNDNPGGLALAVYKAAGALGPQVDLVRANLDRASHMKSCAASFLALCV